MKIISQDYLPVRTFILIGIVLLTTTQTYAQNTNTRLSFTLKNATLKEFVKLIENSTGYSFIYGEEVGIRHKITLKAKEMPLHEVLDTVFKDELISYQFSGRYILLKEKKGQKPVSRKFTISGYVTDGTSSETLIGSNIIESHQYQGTTTNPYGFYSITLPEGETELRFSYLGYATETRKFTLSKDTLLNIRMQGNTQLEEVIIISDKAEAGAIATQMGAVEIPMAQIKNTPSILGEADVMKTIQLKPFFQNNNLICVLNGRQTMCNHQQGLSFGKGHDGFLDFIFILRVSEGSCLIQNHNRRIFQDCSRNSNSLLFSAR